MTPIERHNLRNYFWTAQLIGGLSLGGKMFVDGWKDGNGLLSAVLWAACGFVSVIPLAALAAWLRVRFGPAEGHSKEEVARFRRFLIVAGSCAAVAVLLILAFDHWA